MRRLAILVTAAALVPSAVAQASIGSQFPGEQFDRIAPHNTSAYHCAGKLERFAGLYVRTGGKLVELTTGADREYRRDLYRGGGYEVTVTTSRDRHVRRIHNRGDRTVVYRVSRDCGGAR